MPPNIAIVHGVPTLYKEHIHHIPYRSSFWHGTLPWNYSARIRQSQVPEEQLPKLDKIKKASWHRGVGVSQGRDTRAVRVGMGRFYWEKRCLVACVPICFFNVEWCNPLCTAARSLDFENAEEFLMLNDVGVADFGNNFYQRLGPLPRNCF